MDHDGPRQATEQLRAEPARARTVIVRWWLDDPRDPLRCRGTVRSIEGAQLGSFDDLESLIVLVRSLVAPGGSAG